MAVRLSEADQQYVAEASSEFERALSHALVEHVRAGHAARAVLGDPSSFAERAVHAVAPAASSWDALVGPFVRTDGVQARLKVTRQAVAAKAARRRLLRVITAEGEHLYPLWQFDGATMRPGLGDVLALFPESAVDGWTLAAWLRTSDPEIGEPPLDLLDRGDLDRLRTVARSAARSLSA